MRIKIATGRDTQAGRTLAGYIQKIGYALVNDLPTFTVHLEESSSDIPIIDGVDGDLERRIIYNMEDLGIGKFILQRSGGIRAENSIKIIYPTGTDEIVARSIARAVQEAFNTTKTIEPPTKENKFIKLLKTIFLIPILLVSTEVQAQQFVYGRAWDSVNLAGVDPGDSTNRAIRVNMVSGTISGADGAILDGVSSSIKATVFDYTNSNPLAVRLTDTSGDYVSPGGATPFTDNSAFTGGSTSITNAGALYDTTPPAITDGNAGIFRMNSSRILLVNVTDGTNIMPTMDSISRYGYVRITDGSVFLSMDAVGRVNVSPDSTRSEDAAHITGDFGSYSLTVRQDTPATSTSVDGDYQSFKTDSVGRLWTNGSGVTQPVSGTITVGTFPDNEPINVAQMNGVAVTMGNGASGTGVQRVTIASDSTGQIAVASFPDNEPINVAQLAGVAPNLNSGDTTTGTQRVVLGGAPTLAHNQVSVATTVGGTVICASRAGRRSVVIMNHGTTVVYLGNTGLTTSTGLYLAGVAGAAVSIPTSAAVYGIVAAGTQTVSYMEVY